MDPSPSSEPLSPRMRQVLSNVGLSRLEMLFRDKAIGFERFLMLPKSGLDFLKLGPRVILSRQQDLLKAQILGNQILPDDSPPPHPHSHLPSATSDPTQPFTSFADPPDAQAEIASPPALSLHIDRSPTLVSPEDHVDHVDHVLPTPQSEALGDLFDFSDEIFVPSRQPYRQRSAEFHSDPSEDDGDTDEREEENATTTAASGETTPTRSADDENAGLRSAQQATLLMFLDLLQRNSRLFSSFDEESPRVKIPDHKPRPALKTEACCPICKDNLPNCVLDGCGHPFCTICLKTHLDTTPDALCPICRRPILRALDLFL